MPITTYNTRTISLLNLALGVWLIISAFVWPHTSSQFSNAWIVGALAAIIALIAMRAPGARWGNTALGVWLFVSVWVLPTTSTATWWNHLLVGAALFVVSMAPGYVGRGAPGGRRV